jgi:hypothetical protein
MDHISAILTSACVASTYEVETTKDIVQMWQKIKTENSFTEDIDFISAILATGRIMHGSSDMKDPDRIKDVVDTFKQEVKRRSDDITFDQNAFCAAIMASACVSRSDKIVSAKNIVSLWKEIIEKINISDDYDIVSAILTSSRIADLRCQTEGLIAIHDTFENVKVAVNQKVGHINMTKREIASAYVAAACIEITPKVEKIRDMVESWQAINEQLLIKSNEEYIAAVLTAGRIKDMNAHHLLIPESITEIHSKLLEIINNSD